MVHVHIEEPSSISTKQALSGVNNHFERSNKGIEGIITSSPSILASFKAIDKAAVQLLTGISATSNPAIFEVGQRAVVNQPFCRASRK